TDMILQPLFISQEIFGKTLYDKVYQSGMISIKFPDILRIGIIGNIFDYKDFKTIEPVLAHLDEKYKDRFRLVLFGYDGNEITYNIEQKKFVQKSKNFFLSKIDHDTFHPVSYFKYFEKLSSLN